VEATRTISKELLAEVVSQRRAVQAEVAKRYIGREETVELLLAVMLSQGHVLLEGVPGIAKTTLVNTFAQTLRCDFRRIQFTPDLLPADITGSYILNMKENEFELRRGPIFSNIVLGDEINRAPAKTQSALLEAMQEAQVTVEGDTEVLATPFMVLATQNPVEHEGVYALPEAQVDRFQVKIALGYPTQADEKRILRTYNCPVEKVQPVLDRETIKSWVDYAEAVFVEDGLLEYIVGIIRYTRTHEAIQMGASPRAGLALLRCAKSRALLQGRAHVLPDDIRFLVHPVLAHRLMLVPDAIMDGVNPGVVLDGALATIPFAPHAGP
jgi:MoxR-like ATPase